MGQESGEAPFADVPGRDTEPRFHPEDSRHIRRPEIAAAVLAYIHPVKRFSDDESKRDGAEHVTEYKNEKFRDNRLPCFVTRPGTVAVECVVVFPLSNMLSNSPQMLC